MNVLIVGCGMYVTGRHGTGVGTILASVMQSLGDCENHQITLCAITRSNDIIIAEAAQRIRTATGLKREVKYEAFDGSISDLAQIAKKYNVDVAIVSTPDHAHFEQTKLLLDLGIHCLCVKPLVPTVDQHRQLIELACLRGVHAAIEFHKRWDESNLYARKLLLERKLGKIHNISVDYSQRIIIPTEVFGKWVEKTNIFQYLGIHYVDLVQWLTDSIPIRLFCRGTRGALAELGVKTWDSVHVWLVSRQANGEDFLSQFNLSWIDSNHSPALSDQCFAILGSRGRLEADQRNRGISITLQNQGLQYINPWFSEFLPTSEGHFEIQGYGFRSIAQFLGDCQDILNGKTSAKLLIGRRPTFQDCLPSTRVIEAVNLCLAENKNDFIEIQV